MKAAQSWDGNDRPHVTSDLLSGVGRVAMQGQMRPAIVVVVEVVLDNSLQVTFRQYNHVIQAFTS